MQTGHVTDDRLDAIAGELYALDLDAFTAERNRRARELRGKDRELADAVAGLPKPSAAAWFVDQLVREAPEEVSAALALGPGYRAAQAAFDRDALRELGAERRAALAGVAQAALRIAAARGRNLPAALAADIEQTVLAGIADEAAAAAVRSGRLVRALETIGGEPVDLEGAVAAPGEELAERGAAPRPRNARGSRAGGAADREAARDARADAARAELERVRREAEAARAALAEADEGLRAAADRHGQLARERDAALAEYERLEREVGAAEQARRDAIRERDRANRRAEAAERVVARAEEKL